MPTILKIGGFRFHFYSDEAREPAHIHVECAGAECKFWLWPIRLARNKGVSPHLIRQIERLVFDNHAFLMEKYNEFHKP